MGDGSFWTVPADTLQIKDEGIWYNGTVMYKSRKIAIRRGSKYRTGSIQ